MLVDETLMLRFDTPIGERLRVANKICIAGSSARSRGDTGISVLSPRVYIPLALGHGTHSKGSLVRYRVYWLDPTMDADQLVQRLSPQLVRLRQRTPSTGAPPPSRARWRIARYLQLAFYRVLLAGVGVAGGIHVYEDKSPSVAVRAASAPVPKTIYIYLIKPDDRLSRHLLGALVGAAVQS
jgi:predicted lysophospholipase L1 biosynthesis ABC-type transport system permease subunit